MPDAQGQPILADFVHEVPWDLLDAWGYDGAFYYLSHSWRKEPSQAWIDEGRRRGRILIPVFEDTGRGATGGAALGTAHAQFVNGELARVGHPADHPYANAESDQDSDPAAVLPYYQAFHDAADNKLIIDYAGGDVGRLVKAHGLAVGAWLTCSGGFHGSHDLTGIDIKQRCAGEPGYVGVPGASVDTDIVLNPAILGPHTPPPPLNIGDLTMADAQAILNAQQLQHTDTIAHLDRIEAKVDAIRGGELIDIAVDQADAKADGVKAPLSPPQTGPVAGAAPAPGAPPA